MKNQKSSQNYLVPFLIIAGLFFIFGFVTWINGALIPFMRTINELSESQAYLVATASYISFVVMGLPSSWILEKIGYQRGMSLGLITMGIGALIFIPAAEARTYWMFLCGIFIQGAGMTMLQTASNPYITILGPIDSAAKRISFMGICNKVAGALGSLIFGGLLLKGIDTVNEKLKTVQGVEKETLLREMANSVVLPYICMAVALFVLALLILKAPLPEINPEQNDSKDEQTDNATQVQKTSIFQFPHLWFGVLTLFVYVGAEVIAGDTIIAYGISLNVPTETAKFFTMCTLISMVVGYLLGVLLIPKYLKQKDALVICASLGMIFTLVIVNTTGMVSVAFVALLGLANSLVWPAVWPLTLDGLGKFTKKASALLVMAIAGGAILPLFYGRAVDMFKASGMLVSQAATLGYWILLPCYAVILSFAVFGYKLGKK